MSKMARNENNLDFSLAKRSTVIVTVDSTMII